MADARGEPAVALLVGALAHDGQVGTGGVQRADQAVDVPGERAAVGWHVGRIKKYARRHDRTCSLPGAP